MTPFEWGKFVDTLDGMLIRNEAEGVTVANSMEVAQWMLERLTGEDIAQLSDGNKNRLEKIRKLVEFRSKHS